MRRAVVSDQSQACLHVTSASAQSHEEPTASFSGLIPAVLTPFTPDDRVDVEARRAGLG